jgi:hypothetical protein
MSVLAFARSTKTINLHQVDKHIARFSHNLLSSQKQRCRRIKVAAFFKPSFELKIKGDLIPEAAAEELIGELQALFASYSAG